VVFAPGSTRRTGAATFDMTKFCPAKGDVSNACTKLPKNAVILSSVYKISVCFGPRKWNFVLNRVTKRAKSKSLRVVRRPSIKGPNVAKEAKGRTDRPKSGADSLKELTVTLNISTNPSGITTCTPGTLYIMRGMYRKL